MARSNIFVGRNVPNDITDLEVVIIFDDTHFWYIKHEWVENISKDKFDVNKLNRVLSSEFLYIG